MRSFYQSSSYQSSSHPILGILAVSLFLSAVNTAEARAQDPSYDPIAAVAASSPPINPRPADAEPVVRARANDYAMTFSFGGLGDLSAGGIVNQKAGNLLFTEVGFRAVLSSVTIPFSVGLGIANTTTRTDPSISSTDFGLSATGGVIKYFRVWRRIAPYYGGLFHFHYLDPSGDKNWTINMSLGPVLGVEYYIADRVSLYGQATFQLGVTVTDPVAAIGLGTAISGGGQLGIAFYF